MCVAQISFRFSPACFPLPRQSSRTTASLPYTFNVHWFLHIRSTGTQVRGKPHFHNVRAALDWPALVLLYTCNIYYSFGFSHCTSIFTLKWWRLCWKEFSLSQKLRICFVDCFLTPRRTFRLYLFGTLPESESAISRPAHLFGQNDRVCLARFWFDPERNAVGIDSAHSRKIVESEWILSRIIGMAGSLHALYCCVWWHGSLTACTVTVTCEVRWAVVLGDTVHRLHRQPMSNKAPSSITQEAPFLVRCFLLGI